MSVLDVTRQRSAFTDALRPPPGYVLGACIGTTYSLDFEAFTAVLLAFVGADVEDPLNDAPSVLTTVSRLRSRLGVFVNSGSLHPPRTTNRLFALYDRILRPITLDRGAFHPKVWVLRYDPTRRPEQNSVEPIYRVLTASRNVTDSGCWELGALLQGTKQSSRQQFGSDLSAFCRKVAAAPNLPKALWQLINELKNVEFAQPREAATNLRFDWQWPGKQVLINHLPNRATRVLLISPFVRAEFLTKICERVDELILISTQEELDSLSENTHAQLADAQVFVVTGSGVEDMPTLDLHAKLLVWENNAETETMIGSANATGPGWGCGSITNCEAMVSLRPGLGIEPVMKAFVSPSKGQLHEWIEQYNRKPEVVDPEKEACRHLEKFKRILLADKIHGDYKPDKKLLRLVAKSPVAGDAWPSSVRAEIVPLLQRDLKMWEDYRLIYSAGASFAGIELEDVTAFAIVILRDEHYKDIDVSFVVQFELNMDQQEADARDNAVNTRLLEGVDARNLLLNVLSGLPGGTSRSPSVDQHHGGGHGSEPLLRRASIERILEVCTADPSRAEEVEAVLAACGDAENMSSFRKFWAVFREALAEERAGV